MFKRNIVYVKSSDNYSGPVGSREKLWVIFLLAFLSPILGQVARKIAPGNPGYFEALGTIPIFVFGIWAFFYGRNLPNWLKFPILLWIITQVVFIFPSIIYNDPLTSVSAIFTRIVPMFMAFVAYSTIGSEEDINKALRLIGILALLFTIQSVYVSINGDESLPKLFRTIDKIEESGRSTVKGYYYAATGLFTTYTQLGRFGFIVFVMALSLPQFDFKWKLYNNIILGSGFIILYLSGRRMFTYMAVILVCYKWLFSKQRFNMLLIFLLILISIQWLDDNTLILRKNIEGRLAYLLKPDSGDEEFMDSVEGRLTTVAADRTYKLLLNYPLGTYLGNFGPEGRTFRGEDSSDIETGAQLIAAEMGIMGLIIMAFISIIIPYQLFRHSVRSKSKTTIGILNLCFILFAISFFTKGYGIVIGSGMHSIFYWSVPGLCAALMNRNNSI